jgi:hypothetical protein
MTWLGGWMSWLRGLTRSRPPSWRSRSYCWSSSRRGNRLLEGIRGPASHRLYFGASMRVSSLLHMYSSRGRTPARRVSLAPRRLLPAGRRLRCRDRIFATPPPGDSICTSAVSQSPQKTACKPRPPAGSARRPRRCLTPIITTKSKTCHQESAEIGRKTKKILKNAKKKAVTYQN